MSAYLMPVYTAMIIFPVLSILLTLPFAIYSYRKFGSITFMRVFVLFTFIFYLMAAFFLTMLPLPDIEVVKSTKAPHPQLVPFKFISDFLQHTVLVASKPSTYAPALTQNVVIQPVFNIFLLLPLGVYLRYYFRFSFWKTALTAFILSLFFEITQLTGIYGIYPHAYRLFDVDDLMLNTLGGIIGFFAAPLFTFFLPTRSEMDATSQKRSERVSFVRRFVAYVIDWCTLNVFTKIVLLFGVLPFTAKSADGGDYYKKLLWNALIIFIYFIILPSFTNGRTLGKWAVHIQVQRVGGKKVRFKHLLLRYGLLYYVVFGLVLFPLSIPLNDVTTPQLVLVVLTIAVLTAFLFMLHIVVNFFSKDKRLFYEKMSRTVEVSSYQKEIDE